MVEGNNKEHRVGSSGKASLQGQDLGALKTECEKCGYLGMSAFWAEGKASAKALRWEHVRGAHNSAGRPVGLELWQGYHRN
jgi:hypothetical protein